MPVENRTVAPPRSTTRTRRTLLGRRGRRAVLLIHLLAAGTWIGVDVVVAVLVGTGALATEVTTRALAYQALGTFLVTPMLVAGLTTLVSGVLLGLGSTWGLVRYWWVAIKLALNIIMCVLIMVSLAPGMPAVVAHGIAVADGVEDPAAVQQLIFPPVVSLTTLGVASWLGVFKPGGRIRRRGTSAVQTTRDQTRPD
ncbi:hypothetical protein ACQCX2_12040 [Propionibacteriaceae bacterium Y1700]|uniref:hypothetical protein n=1 Tax=Microlunatus sp. Y1700 TaxID=3418487 RepID=UPI003DA73049